MRDVSLLTLLLSACGSPVISDPGTKPTDDTGTGACTSPDIALSADSVDFGEIHLGEREIATVTVYNRGCVSLAISAVTIDSPFSATPTALTVGPGNSSTVTLAVQASTYEDFDVAVVFTSDDPDTPTLSLPVTASVITDEDGDGHDVVGAEGGDDCDDTNPEAYTGAEEIWYNGEDENCDGLSDWDQDYDGYESSVYNDDPSDGGGDCQDTNPEYHPGALDEPYDNRDTDCDGRSEFDWDGDGFNSDDYGSGTDCDDFDASVNIEGTETLNRKDDDCDGRVDIDGYVSGATYIWDAAGTYDRMGYALAVGDLDADGAAEVIIGGPYNGATGPNAAGRGGVGVFRGGVIDATGTALDEGENWMRGTGTSDLLGYQLAVIGDYDLDGNDDVAIAASGTSSNAGTVYLVDGRDLLSGYNHEDAHTTFTASSSNTYLGEGIASRVDLDGDGSGDAVLTYASGSFNYVGLHYGGSAGGAVGISSMDALYTTDGTDTPFARSAPVGGDIDGDGRDDLVMGDGNADRGSTDSGAIWVLYGQATQYTTGGSTADLENTATVLAYGSSSEHFGHAVQIGEDWDGDGDDELWTYTVGEGLYVIEGGAHMRARIDPATDAAVYYQWGSSDADVDLLRSAGDWTGDGVDEMIVYQASGTGEINLFSSEIQSGDYLRGDALLASMFGSVADGNSSVGSGLAPLSDDLDGDGDEDLVIGDPGFSNNAGRVYIFTNPLVE